MVVELKGDQLEISNSTARTTRIPVTEFFQLDHLCYFSHCGLLRADGSIQWSNDSVWSRLSGDREANARNEDSSAYSLHQFLAADAARDGPHW